MVLESSAGCGQFHAAHRPDEQPRPDFGFQIPNLLAARGLEGVRVNAVAPGVVPTEMSSFAKTEAGRTFTVGMQALKRLADPSDIAAAIGFLASEEARWITGQTLRVDGGSKL